MAGKLKSVLLPAIAAIIICCTLTAYTAAEEIFDEIELDEPSGLIGRAEDIVFHSANENSPVKCNHPLCFWNMKMGWMDEAEIWEVLFI